MLREGVRGRDRRTPKNQAEGGNAESGRNADAKDASDAKNGGAA